MRQRWAANAPNIVKPKAGVGTPLAAPRRVSASRRRPPADLGPSLAELAFDGAYRRRRFTADEIADHDGRVEFWDSTSETAFEVRETSPHHERPAQLLSALAELIAAVRGKPIRCFGTMDLAMRGEDGRLVRRMQADQSLYLHPERCNLVGRSAMVVGENHYPDVVLEVDNTTDVRRHKLKLYQAWGFPEIWVEVPEESPRPEAQHGTTIYVLEDGAFRVVETSRAFPGWKAADIHVALNERRLSTRTAAILERIGTELGEREGSGPDDHPVSRSLRRRARQEAQAEAAKRELASRAAMVRQLLIARGIPFGAKFPLDQPAFAGASAEAIADAAARCESPDDFAARLRDVARRQRKRPLRRVS